MADMKKSGRTPEQQAARDARKAAKLAKAAKEADSAASAPAADIVEPHAESSAQAAAISSAEDQGTEAEAKSKKRRRTDEERLKGQEGVDDLLEVDVDAPEPMSKAEARAAKKRAKKGLPEGKSKRVKHDQSDGNDNMDEKDVSKLEQEDKKKLSTKKQNSIWIGNLSFRTTPETLKGFIERGITDLGGTAEGSVTRVNLPKKAGRGQFAENKGFAYVDFATPELQQMAVGLSESFFEGRKLLIKLGSDHDVKPDARTPRPERPKPGLANQPHSASSTLFVGNLSFDTTETGLRDFIEKNAGASSSNTRPVEQEEGAVPGNGEANDEEREGTPDEDLDKGRGGKKSGLRKVRLGAFEDSGRCKGFAFLDFHNPSQATAVLTNRRNSMWDGRRLLLQYASESASKRSGHGYQKPSNNPRPDKRTRLQEAGKPDPRQSRPRGDFHQRVRDEPPHIDDSAFNDAVGPVTDFNDEGRSGEGRQDKRGKKWEATGRPRPGAALAMAKRENMGIVAAQGSRTTFD